MASDDADVLVIGAGLAGLRCAGILAAAGREVRVFELGDDVGAAYAPMPSTAFCATAVSRC